MKSYPQTTEFINRQKEIAQVERIIKRIKTLKPPAIQGIHYQGIPGIGKSRILKHAQSRCQEKNLFTVWIDFQGATTTRSPLDYLLHFSDQLEQREAPPRFRDLLLNATGKTTNKTRQAQLALPIFLRGVEKRLKDRPLVLLMDSCEQCPAEVFDWIGEHVLVKLRNASIGAITLFLASRGPLVAESSWPIEVIHSTDDSPVLAFDFKATKQHIAALDKQHRYRGREKDIQALTFGHPFSTEAILHFLQELAVNAKDLRRRPQSLINKFYDEVIHRHLCIGAKAWSAEIFDIACIPRRFDPLLLKAIAPEYLDSRYKAGLRDLQRPANNLIEVDAGRPAYRLEKTVRQLLHTAFSILQPSRAAELNQKTQQFYEHELARDLQSGRPAAATLLEWLYHHIQIARLSKDVLAADALADLLTEKLRACFHPEQADDKVQLTELSDLLAKDVELLEILGRNTVARLQKAIAQFAHEVPPKHLLLELIIRHTPPAEYHVGCHAASPALVPIQTLHTQVKFPLANWRAEPEENGRVAFNIYLNEPTQALIRKLPKHAIQLTTDTMDIPFELLHDGTDFLCLRRPFSRRIEMNATPKRWEAALAEMAPALVIGNPSGDLPAAEEEATAVADLLAARGVQVERFIGAQQADLNQVAKRMNLQAYRFIHFAGHGFFNIQQPALSGLLFGQGMMLSADELKRYLKGPAFIFFSACWAAAAKPETARYNYQGRFIQNLAIAALEGGAYGCLGPMWEIEDRAARDFALTFYTQLLAGQSSGEAVLRARKKVRHRKTDCWASWVLFGDPFSHPF